MMHKTRISNTGGTAVTYLRAASADQRDQVHGLAMQRAACQREAEWLGIEVVDEFADAGVSGNRTDRPGLQRLLTCLTEQSVGYLIMQDHTRLSRKTADRVALTGAIEQTGVTLVAVDGSAPLDPAIMLALTEVGR